MPEFCPCPYLGSVVEVTDERYAHVLLGHPDLAPEQWARVGETLASPDKVLRSASDDRGKGFLAMVAPAPIFLIRYELLQTMRMCVNPVTEQFEDIMPDDVVNHPP